MQNWVCSTRGNNEYILSNAVELIQLVIGNELFVSHFYWNLMTGFNKAKVISVGACLIQLEIKWH